MDTAARRVYRLMLAALDEVPPHYRQRLGNVSFGVARTLSPRERRRQGIRGTLYGLYEGIPLTRRDSGYDRVMPDRITLFWGPLVRDFADDDLAEEVRKTLFHEIAHFFGLDEDDLEDTLVK
jgi:predicted Zn-dependent protease with MMP-like domain